MSEDYSIITGRPNTFSIVDYALFGLTLAFSLGIGLFYAIKDRNKQETKEFLLGGKKMAVFPVAMSLVVSFMSALTLLGTPAEIYNFTTMFWWICLSFVLAMGLAARVFIPFFYNLGITSVFQYVELRFNKPTRTLAVALFVIPMLIYMAIVLYAPSLAFSAVTGLDLWGAVVGVGVIVTVYTTLGGMKAVLWTDTFQAMMMAAGLLAVFIQGCIAVGGFGRAWEIASNRSRIMFDDFSFDPSTRHSFWSLFIGGGLVWTSNYGVNQAQVQRTLSCPTLRKAQWALLVNLPGLIFIVTMCCLIGIVMFAFYADCYPLRFNELIFSSDQLMPLFVMDILSATPGVPGVFLSCIYSGSLSTLSSGLSALSAVIPHNFIVPFFCQNRKLTDKQLTIMSKVIVLALGCLAIGLTFVAATLGSVMQAGYSVTSAIGGPLFGLFVLGMFFPWANSAGAIVGTSVSAVFTVWICIGSFVHRASTAVPSPMSVAGCNWNVTTTLAYTTTTLNSSTAPTSGSSDPFIPMYTVSYFHYTPIGMTTTVLVGLFVSLITGPSKIGEVHPRLLCPLFDRLFPCLPEKILKPLRFGINYSKNEESPVVKRNNDSQDLKSPTWKPYVIQDVHVESPPNAGGKDNLDFTDITKKEFVNGLNTRL